jgi:hypothetical protein
MELNLGELSLENGRERSNAARFNMLDLVI